MQKKTDANIRYRILKKTLSSIQEIDFSEPWSFFYTYVFFISPLSACSLWLWHYLGAVCMLNYMYLAKIFISSRCAVTPIKCAYERSAGNETRLFQKLFTSIITEWFGPAMKPTCTRCWLRTFCLVTEEPRGYQTDKSTRRLRPSIASRCSQTTSSHG